MNDETLAALERAAALAEKRYINENYGTPAADAALIRALIERERAGGERAQIVAWLCTDDAMFIANTHSGYMSDLADAIASGAHATVNSAHLK